MEQPLTLAERQRQNYLVLGGWQFAGLGVVLGVALAAFIGLRRDATGNELLLNLQLLALLVMGLLVVMAVCFAIGTALFTRNSSVFRARLEESLRSPAPADSHRVPAVLARVVGGRRQDLRQLLYAAHLPEGVGPVAVALPGDYFIPMVGSGAWLLIDPANPDIAWFAPGQDAASSAAALQDSALVALKSPQQGTRLSGRAYLVPALIGLGVLVATFALVSLLMGSLFPG